MRSLSRNVHSSSRVKTGTFTLPIHRDLSGPDVAVAFKGLAVKVHSLSSTQRGY